MEIAKGKLNDKFKSIAISLRQSCIFALGVFSLQLNIILGLNHPIVLQGCTF